MGSRTNKLYTKSMKKTFEHPKLEWCKKELKPLLKKLMDGNYQKTAEQVFGVIAHSGVETDFNPELKTKPTLEEFLSNK